MLWEVLVIKQYLTIDVVNRLPFSNTARIEFLTLITFLAYILNKTKGDFQFCIFAHFIQTLFFYFIYNITL